MRLDSTLAPADIEPKTADKNEGLRRDHAATSPSCIARTPSGSAIGYGELEYELRPQLQDPEAAGAASVVIRVLVPTPIGGS